MGQSINRRYSAPATARCSWDLLIFERPSMLVSCLFSLRVGAWVRSFRQLPTNTANSSTSLALKASRSSGLRLLTRPWSTWTSSSTHSAPALRRSVCRLGHEVSVRPSTTSALIRVHGAWQIAPTGLPASKKARTNLPRFGGDQLNLRTRRFNGLARTGQLDLLDPLVGNEDRDLLALQLV